MTAERPLCMVIGALGGQGGGVLADWLIEAARLAGYPAQATSIPGVAQRTGATTYYIEVWPEQNPSGDPVFCLFPSAGDVDLVAALEPTEAGRALERGLVTGRTTVITSAARAYSTAEKSIAGDGAIAAAPILQALGGAARRLIRIDAANPYGRDVNAMILGAVVGSGALPITAGHARAAIESRGLAVDANRQSFERGLEAARGANGAAPAPAAARFDSPPPGFERELAAVPAALRPLIGHALARLVDYQDAAYARVFCRRLRVILALDHGPYRLTATVAQRLAAWMSFEDVIRVAQLKTRPGRLGRLRGEAGARAGEPVTVVDYFSPDREQWADLLPPRAGRLLPPGRAHGRYGDGAHLRWRTSAPWAYAALRLLAALKPIRPRSAGFAREQQALERWLAAVAQAARADYALACSVAELGAWARGYGAVRARGLARLDALFDGWPRRLAEDAEPVRRQVAAALADLRHTPDD